MNGDKAKLFKILILLSFLLFTSILFAQGNPFLTGSKPTDPPVTETGILKHIVSVQKNLQTRIHNYMKSAVEDKNILPVLIGCTFAFIYGILHALGPGHRKMVLVSAILKKEISLKTGILAGISIAMLHAVSAIIIISLLHWFAQKSLLLAFNSTQITIDTISYGLLVIIGVVLLLMQIFHIGHSHKKEISAIIVSAALVPCPGAAAIMLVAISFNAFAFGVVLVTVMSAGMAVITTGVSIITILGRNSVLKLLERNDKALHVIEHLLEYATPIMLILIGGLFILPHLI